jgi:puromycin-sensitive aminopeptidase
LRPDLEAARFEGVASIEVEVVEPTDRLVLNAVDLEIADARLELADGSALAPEVAPDQPDQKLHLGFGKTLPLGRHRLTIEFAGVLNDRLQGFYRSTFRDGNGAERVIATTQFESSDARRAFPCWDEPDMKAVFAITLVVPPGLTGLSNSPVESTRQLDDGYTELRFADTIPMSTYLVAMIVGPYEVTEPELAEGVPVRIAAVPGKLALSGYAMEAARHAVRFLSGYFGIPYPGQKLDHVAVPDFAFGAMENLGCVTYRESLLLADPGAASAAELQQIAIVVAHETAHMWFGDLVTMKWWNGTWLNEAFATFMERTTADDFRPDWDVWTAFGAAKAAALTTDGLRASRPVEFPVDRPEDADSMFEVLTYQKGGSVLKMLEQYLGPDVFRNGISDYLAAHAYGNTETSDLWDALESASGEPVGDIMQTWIYQSGYPTVDASIDGDRATVVLGQERFLYAGPEGDGSGRRWAVPVNLRASVDGTIRQERLLLKEEGASHTFPGPVDWVVVNDGAWGFYRVRYSPDLWARLAAAGPASVLTPLERLQFLGDTWASVVAGRAELNEWAEMAEALAGDADPDIWGSIAGGLRTLDLLADEGDRPALRRFAGRLARPAWASVGWDPHPGETQRTATARSRILSVLADVADDADVIEEGGRRFAAHLEARFGSSQAPDPLPPDLIQATAYMAVAAGGQEPWARALDAYQRAVGPLERLRYLYALAGTRLEDLRRQTLELMLGPEVRSQDAPFVIAGVLTQRSGAGPGWDWVEANWGHLEARLPPSLLIRVLEPSATFVDPALAARVRSFCAGREFPVTPLRIEQILERTDIQVRLAGRLRGTIAGALR